MQDRDTSNQRTFAQLVLTGETWPDQLGGGQQDISLIVEFGACLNDWKQELDQILEIAREEAQAKKSGDDSGAGKKACSEFLKGRVAELRSDLVSLQKRLDEVDVSTDSFWLELMLWHELGRTGSRPGYNSAKSCYLNWVKSGNPLHFLHSSPLQFGSDFLGDILRELDRDLGVDVRRRYISLLESRHALVVILDTEGLLSVEARDDVFDKQVALMTMACSDLVIVNNRGELGRHVGDLFQVCLFALYHLKLAKISPAIGALARWEKLYEWVATVKRSLEESVQELQQKESIFVMPSAFNDDVQFGLQVFHWIARAKASQRSRLAEAYDAEPGASVSFASLSQWYDHARTVWQTLSMCLGTFGGADDSISGEVRHRSAAVSHDAPGKMHLESEQLIQRLDHVSEVHAIDNAFRGQLDGLRDAVLQADVKLGKFTDEQVKNDKRFSLLGPMRRKYASVDSLWRSAVHLVLEQFNLCDTRSLPMSRWNRNSMDHLFEEISARVNDLLLEQGSHINVQNVERVFEEKWSQVMAETLRKQRPNLDRAARKEMVMQEVISHFNAALLNLKSQFRKAHIFHGVKSLTSDIREMSEACSSFLLAKKGIGAALVPLAMPQVDNLWIKLVDTMRLEVDQQGQMSDAAALKILNRLNSADHKYVRLGSAPADQEMEAADQLRQLLHRLGSPFVQKSLGLIRTPENR
ncbi:hypothetical protein AK812_SmicGene3107 [Symbiodinium microadriaticum]|uniref:Uncharacterized protein n=1 Tax=Symbiodinium microadriaticum TaxID=2951 RepID=A0A1Q9EZI6_SYMMI|nr:hypothetical protein AK812_SmicGene3107 [Symbiodinium microadriaticum]